ncbi:polyadenylate-binding protein-interacting protein 2-like [Anarhichas minor]|uniref:polyadenylate-binding protein-interacting protein 2 n=1 Tax=Anarrhichthys ocellatus TaxID=433405 RepID=UPI0012EE7570|nr:polyadenylate-binding protein-interacting protein 2 [Anarrhichthys ocellatus]
MRDPRLSMTINTEVVLSGQFISDQDPFAEYMWMENEEEFNQQVEEELWEEEFMERCFQEMLEEEEQWEWFIPSRDLPQLQVRDLVMNSSLNPNAKEFTPGIQKHVM